MAKGKAGKAVKITLIVLFALIVLVCGGGYAYYFSITRSPLPQVDGELRAPGLKERVEVIRDSYGIPHIYAKNLIDLFFAQGYVQAQDRWPMTPTWASSSPPSGIRSPCTVRTTARAGPSTSPASPSPPASVWWSGTTTISPGASPMSIPT